MKKQLTHFGRLVAITALGSVVGQAQATGFDSQLKLRTGYGLTAADDNLARRTLGFGFEVGYTAPWGRLGVELGYQYKPGTQYLSDYSTIPTLPGKIVDPGSSVDSRKNTLNGITARLSFEKMIPGSSFYGRAGLQFGGSKYRQEYLGDLGDVNWATYEDTYSGSVTKSTLAVSPFAGVGYAINEASSVELNLVAVSYTSINFEHIAGSGTASLTNYTVTKKHSVPHIEIGYSFRF
jgi:hypothetical protein